MKTVKNLMLLVFAGALLVSCSKVSYKKTPGGMPYKIFPGKDTTKVYAGSFIKLHLTQKIKDSVYFTSTETVPIYFQVNGTPQPYDLSEVWTKLKVGDSMEATQMMDTFINRSPQNIPPQFHKGDRIITTVKILGVFSTDSAAKADGEKVKSEFLAKDLIKFEKIIADKKINTVKTPSGAYVEFITPGAGTLADTGNYVSVNYTCMKLEDGTKYDSNTDSAFHHLGPYSFTAGAGEMVRGFDEAVLMMRKGSKVKVFMPSGLAYGDRPPQGSPIKPFTNIMFDLELVDIKDKAPAPPAQSQQPGKVDMPQR